MDPVEALRTILYRAQAVGQPMDRQGVIQALCEIKDTADDLLEWINKGGFKPDFPVVITHFDEVDTCWCPAPPEAR